MCRAVRSLCRSQLVKGLACELVELTLEPRIRCSFLQLLAKPCTHQPARAPAVRHDVGDGLAMHGEGDTFPCSDCVDNLTSSVTQIPHANLHVRQRSTVEPESPAVTPFRFRTRRQPARDAGSVY